MQPVLRRGIEAFDRGEIVELGHASAGWRHPSARRPRLLIDRVAVQDIPKHDPPPIPLSFLQPRSRASQARWIVDLIAIDAKYPCRGVDQRNQHLVRLSRVSNPVNLEF